MAMTHWYYVVLPLVVFAVMSLLRFRGCQFNPRQSDNYGGTVKGDGPTAWFRLEESPGAPPRRMPPDRLTVHMELRPVR